MSVKYVLAPILCACALLASGAPTSAEPMDKAALAAEIADLESELAKTPEDVDIRLKLAYRRSWQGNGPEARAQAEKVIAAAPAYWDAHILRSRVTAWAGEHDTARRYLKPVLEAEPKNTEALELLVTISLWSKDWRTAEETLNTLISIAPKAEYHFQLAQVAVEELDPLRARREAGRALELDPDHERATALRKNVQLVKLYATTQFEFFPALEGDDQRAYSQTLVASVLPGSSLGVSFRYDFKHRFRTNNHRFGARVNLQAAKDTILSTSLLGGVTEVLPKWSGDLGVVQRLTHEFAIGLRYSLDLMQWPGTLHRATAQVTSQIDEHVALGAQYFGGIMRHCGESEFVQGAAIQSRLSRGRLAATVRYAFGTELERPALPPLLQGRLGDDFCLDALGGNASGSPIDLAETRAHELGVGGSVKLGAATLLLAGYGIQLRFDNSEVHLGHISAQRAF